LGTLQNAAVTKDNLTAMKVDFAGKRKLNLLLDIKLTWYWPFRTTNGESSGIGKAIFLISSRQFLIGTSKCGCN
jgi:hypothetical protein